MNDEEVILDGGNRNRVVRIGDTVRRTTGRHSHAVHELLSHLEVAGFSYSPRFLGVDEEGREILSHVDGTVGNHPMPEPIRSIAAMESAVAVVRQLHDVTVGLRLPAGHAKHLPLGAVPEVICHWDAAPYNFVFEGVEPVGLIDFDEAGPGRRVDDLAYFAYRFAPLCADENLTDGGWPRSIDRLGRLRRIFELYPTPHAHLVPDLIVDRLTTLTLDPRTPAAHVPMYELDRAFVREHRQRIAAQIRG
ncbi:phosphotransferase [Rhodococcus sp. P1Y]|uniref:phosphotransferase n=1 Tax=Rhodococcus sp. P1Y TaxID=1302308 RepID=UPI00137976AF|nr:phosphotransferase [Rhodococcus sp. P1Y]